MSYFLIRFDHYPFAKRKKGFLLVEANNFHEACGKIEDSEEYSDSKNFRNLTIQNLDLNMDRKG